MDEYKFQKLAVYQMALEYLDHIYSVVDRLPTEERFNLSSQIIRAATSIPLNIAEGSTGQSDKEQTRFLGLDLSSHLETAAYLYLIERRNYLSPDDLISSRKMGRELFVKLSRFRKSLNRK